MIYFFEIPEQKKTVAVIKNCEFDVINKLERIVGDTTIIPNPERYLINHTYRAVVTCHEEDAYDPAIGRREAKRKLLDHYYKAIDNKIARFEADIKKINERIK